MLLFFRGSEFLPDFANCIHNYSIKVIIGDFNADPRSNPEDAKVVDSIVADNSLFSIPFGTTFHKENVDRACSLSC